MLGGPVMIYFHGVPGSPRELTLFGRSTPDGWLAPDRSRLHPGRDFAGHCDALAGKPVFDTAARSPALFAAMAAILREGLGHGRANYVREIGAYVRDWSAILPAIRHPVTLWHGAEDNWSPPAMAEALAERLPYVTALHRLPGLSHYSALRAWLDA